MLSVTFLFIIIIVIIMRNCFAECHYAESHILIAMLSVTFLFIILNVIMLSAAYSYCFVERYDGERRSLLLLC
jgi:hypothetical protein